MLTCCKNHEHDVVYHIFAIHTTRASRPPWSYHMPSHHIADLKRRNCLIVGTDKPQLKAKMQSISDDVVRKRLLGKPRFELASKGIFILRRCYIFRQDDPGLWVSNLGVHDHVRTLPNTCCIKSITASCPFYSACGMRESNSYKLENIAQG